jgi:hypothetical protein
MSDQLHDRLEAVDPARHSDEHAVDGAWISSLAQRTLAESTAEGAPIGSRRRLVAPLAVAAATTLIVGGAVTATVVIGDDAAKDRSSVVAAKPPLKLKAPSPLSASMCIQFSPDILAEMPVAFSGTVASVGADTVTLDVDHWYRGGDASSVEIGRLDESAIALVGIPAFSVGDRFLVTATDGVVNACGYTAPWSSDMAAVFDSAFS